MDLVDALDAALSDRYALHRNHPGLEPRTPLGEKKGLMIRMNRIMDKFGGRKESSARRKAAEASGIPYSTWNHALKGRNVSKKNVAKLGAAFTRLITSPGRAWRVKKVGPPGDWLIKAVVVCYPGDEDGPAGSSDASRYVNGHGSGISVAQAAALSGIEDEPAYRTFRAEGLDSAVIVNAWLDGGGPLARSALLTEVEEAYGETFGFEGDHVEVTFSD